MAVLLVVEDEKNVRRATAVALRDRYEIVEAASVPEAIARCREQPPDAVLLDLKLEGQDGLELLPELRAIDPDLPVVVLTAHGSIESCVRAMKAGAADYLLKPFDLEELRLVLARAIEVRRLTAEVHRLREKTRAPGGRGIEAILGESAAVKNLRDLVTRLAPHEGAVLITGPSGTGKDLVARALHEESPRAEGPFVVVNCAAIPEGLIESELFGHERGAFTGASARRRGCFELAEEGTIFLDEIGELPLKLQPKLLRVLQDGTFSRVGSEKPLRTTARVVSATNRDLAAEQKAGRFREDLFYRLNTFTIDVPPLSARREDVPLLLQSFLERASQRLGKPVPRVPSELVERLERHPWPGNVREVEHAAERLAVLADGEVRVEDLPPAILREGEAAPRAHPATATQESLSSAVDGFEKVFITAALAREGGHRARTARALGVSLRTLHYKIARYRIDG